MPASTPATAASRPSPRLGWEAYLHLTWLAFLFFQPIFDPGSDGRTWLLAGLLLLGFLPLYFWGFFSPRHHVPWTVAAMALFGLAFTAHNSGAATFLIYAAALAGGRLPLRQAVVAMGLLVATLAVAMLLSTVPYPYRLFAYLPPMLLVVAIGASQVYYSAQERANLALRRAHDEIERVATIAERERIARDLHDLLGHTLSVVALKSELAARLAEADPERAGQEMREVEQVARQALGEVREAVKGYRQQGLAAELAQAGSALAAAGTELDGDLGPTQPPPRVEAVLALVLREALTNVLRHAEARLAKVRLRQDGQGWRLQVEDDGRGGPLVPGQGLSGLRERVEEAGGVLELDDRSGLSMSVWLPEQPDRARRVPVARPA